MYIYVQHLNMLLISFSKSSFRTSIMIWYGMLSSSFIVSIVSVLYRNNGNNKTATHNTIQYNTIQYNTILIDDHYI